MKAKAGRCSPSFRAQFFEALARPIWPVCHRSSAEGLSGSHLLDRLFCQLSSFSPPPPPPTPLERFVRRIRARAPVCVVAASRCTTTHGKEIVNGLVLQDLQLWREQGDGGFKVLGTAGTDVPVGHGLSAHIAPVAPRAALNAPGAGNLSAGRRAGRRVPQAPPVGWFRQ